MNGRQVRTLPFSHTSQHQTNTTSLLQIKHAVGSARSIAREKSETLEMKHIESVLEVVEAWNDAKALR